MFYWVKRTAVAAALLAAMAASPAHAILDTNFTAIGPDPASIQGTVDAFRTALGALNAPAPVNNPDGRREINWDAAPDFVSDPNPFPGDFFNTDFAPRARGLAMTPVGTGGFGLSSDPGDAGAGQPSPPLFTLGPFGFQAFSPNRIFAVFGANQFDIGFFNPANPTQAATVDGFGAVFVDVDEPGTTLDFFDLGGSLLATVAVPDQRFVTPAGSLSFAGATFTYEQVARVRVTAGASGLEGCGNTNDCVAMDDFILGEPKPVPVPPAALMGIVGLTLAGFAAYRRRDTSSNI